VHKLIQKNISNYILTKDLRNLFINK